MQTDINALVAGIGGDGVVSGCAVTAQSTPDMTVAVAAGVARVNGANVTVSAGNVTITTANATNPRIDLIVVNSSGTKSATAGTAAANPKAPDIPASSVLLAMVYVPANQTTITNSLITDKRAVIPTIPAEGRPAASGIASAVLPGVELAAIATDSFGTGNIIYMPIYVTAPLTFSSMLLEVTTAASAGATARLGVYNADTNWQPTSLVIDAGTVATDSTGVKTATVSTTTLLPGRYLLALTVSASATFRIARGGNRLLQLRSTLGSSAFYYQIYVSATYAALASTGVAWVNVAPTGSGAFGYFCFLGGVTY